MRSSVRLALVGLPLFVAACAFSKREAPATRTTDTAFAKEEVLQEGTALDKSFAAPPPPALPSPPAPLASAAPEAPAALGPMARSMAPTRMAAQSAPRAYAASDPSGDSHGTSGGLGGLGALGHGAGGGGISSAGSSASAAGRGYEGAFGGPAIAAGEWDDNANYREFMKYLSTEATQERLPIHRVDVSDRRFLVVRDEEGRPVPHCRVTVSDENQHATTLTTLASGRAILFPHAEGLTTRNLTATSTCPGGGTIASHPFAIDDQDGSVDLRLSTKRELPANRPVDVAFILDTTGSMGEEIDAVRSTIGKVAHELGRQNFAVRLGLVEYKDRGDAFVTKVHPFSSSSDAFLADVAKVTAGGGGDLPESVNEGLHIGLTQLQWGQDSVARFAFLIGDAPPHLDYANDYDYAVEMKRAAHDGVQLFTVAASGMDGLGQAVFRQVAEYTGGTNLFVLRGGAGPQSTGAGDPKSSCGGTHTNYSSGNLDGLILGKITHELHSLDGDAMRIAGLYRDETAKPCNERIAMAD